MHGRANTGLAILRRDGFASLDADSAGGEISTRPLRFTGKHLFVNVDSQNGELRAEVLGPNGGAIEPFTSDNCHPISVDGTLREVSWNGANDLSALSGRPIRYTFFSGPAASIPSG